MKKIVVAFLLFCILGCSSFAAEGTERTIKVNRSVTDEIYESGEVDCFNFSISRPGSIQIKFDFDVKGSYIVKLIDVDNNKEIQYNDFHSDVNTSDGRYEKLSNKMRVGKGEYQVQVSRGYYSDCEEEYEFEVLYDEENSDRYEKEPNNDAKYAMLIDFNKNVTGNLQADNDVDYYMVELPNNGEMWVEFEFDNEANYDFEIFADNNGKLEWLYSKKFEALLNQNSDMYFDVSEKFRIPGGNYYFKISKSWNGYSNEDYVLSVNYSRNTYGNYELENNNDAKYATEITANDEFIGNFNTDRDVDYYKVNVGYANKLTVKMNVPVDASYRVSTYREENGELKEIKYEEFSNKEIPNLVTGEEQEVSSGTYYFRVSPRNYSNEDYTFLVSTNSTYRYNKTTVVLEIGNPYMLVNNVTHPIDGNRGTAPKILNNRTMLPARAIIEAFGGEVLWNDLERGIWITLDGKTIYLTLDSDIAYVDGEAKTLEVPATSINGRAMVPVSFVMNNLGGSVIWNATTGAVTITY